VELKIAVRLIQKAFQPLGPEVWADFGAGSGLFTNALGTLLQNGSTIYAIDKVNAFEQIGSDLSRHTLRFIEGDFTRMDSIPDNLDGLLMGNSLHFVKDKFTFLKSLQTKLKANGKLIVVEYNMDQSNPWVPFPVSRKSLEELLENTGFEGFTPLGEQPSAFNRANIYSAFCKNARQASSRW
jgi:ubiquinone/menaquinone biosynthesis C-methylase UbiE